jgi:DNA-binding protein
VFNVSNEQNIIYIGSKPVMSYVLAVITSFSSPTTQTVTLKARGRSITTAVDVAEITRRRFMKNLSINGIVIGTEDLAQEGGGTRAVSTIEIGLKKTE